MQKAWQNWIDKWTKVRNEQMQRKNEMFLSGETNSAEYGEVCNNLSSAEDKLGYGKRVYALAHKWVVGLGEDIPTSEQFDKFYDAAIQGDMQAAIMMLGSIIGRSNLNKVADTKPGNKAVIGKVKDLKKLRPGENSLLKHLPNKGNPKLNWKQNSSVLRTEMNKGLPIRDASVNSAGELIRYPNSFLEMERNLLTNHGWIYNAKTTLWMPPQ